MTTSNEPLQCGLLFKIDLESSEMNSSELTELPDKVMDSPDLREKLRRGVMVPRDCGNEKQVHRTQCELDLNVKEQQCPRDWLHHLDRCYRYFELAKDWEESREYCQVLGSQLVVVDSQPELVRSSVIQTIAS